MNEGFSATHLFLIHGVGLPNRKQFGDQLESKIKDLDIGPVTTTKIDWNEILQQPFVDLLLNLRQIAQLMRGLAGAAALPVPNERIWSRIAYLFLHLAMILGPFMIVWTGVTYGKELLSTMDGVPKLLVKWAVTPLSFCIPPTPIGDSSIPRLYWSGVGLLAFAVVLTSVIDGGFSGLSAGLRRCLVSGLWPIMYVITLCASWIAAVYGFIYVFALSVDAFQRTLSQVSIGTDGVPFVGVSLAMNFVSVVPVWFSALLVASIGLLSANVLAWLFKVFADVACFVGDREYAEAVVTHAQNKFHSSIRKIQGGNRVVVVGHSLGSAIAVTALLRSASTFPPATRLYLVTMGSPITRLIGRFFPGITENADDLADRLKAIYSDFFWLNIFRPLDPVGTRLFRRQGAYTRDVSTGQWHKLPLVAHIGYWDDDRVINLTRSVIGEFEKIPPANEARQRIDITERKGPDNHDQFLRLNQWIGNSILLRALLLVVSVGVVSVNVFESEFLQPKRDRAANETRLRENGRETHQGWLYSYSQQVMSGGGGYSMGVLRTDYVVVFQPIDSKQYLIYRLYQPDLPIRLSRVLGQKGEETRVRLDWYETQAARVPVIVRYLPGDPSIFDFPEFAKKSRFEYAAETTFSVFVAVLPLLFLWAPLSVLVLGPFYFWVLPVYFGWYESRSMPAMWATVQKWWQRPG